MAPAGGGSTGRTSDLHERALKVDPRLAGGDLVRVAGAQNQVEGELIQALMLEAGVPSMLRRSAGFDVPDFLAAGPRDVMVPRVALATAREVLLGAEIPGAVEASSPVSPGRLLAGLAIALALGALAIWVLWSLTS